MAGNLPVPGRDSREGEVDDDAGLAGGATAAAGSASTAAERVGAAEGRRGVELHAHGCATATAATST